MEDGFFTNMLLSGCLYLSSWVSVVLLNDNVRVNKTAHGFGKVRGQLEVALAANADITWFVLSAPL